MRRFFIILAIIYLPIVVSTISSVGESRGSVTTFDHQALHSAVSEFIRSQLSTPFDSISVSIDFPKMMINSEQITDLRFERINEKPLVGTCILKMLVSLSDGTEISEVLTTRIRIYRNVAVSAYRLHRHKILAPDEIRIELREITSLPDRPIACYEEITDQRTRRSISADAVLLVSDFEPVPVVERGSRVTVSVVVGSVSIKSKGIALEDGLIGDEIHVRDLTTGRRLVGTVVDKGVVLLECPST